MNFMCYFSYFPLLILLPGLFFTQRLLFLFLLDDDLQWTAALVVLFTPGTCVRLRDRRGGGHRGRGHSCGTLTGERWDDAASNLSRVRVAVIGPLFGLDSCRISSLQELLCLFLRPVRMTTADVVAEGLLQGKVSPAVGTLVGLLSGVGATVPPKLSRGYKRSLAVGTAVRFLPCVSAHVSGQGPLLGKGLPTVRAVVRGDASVEAFVSDQGTLQGEAFVAVVALVWPLPGVSPLVVSELCGRVTALITGGAGELLPDEALHHLRVHGLQVALQVPVSREGLDTQTAAVGPLPGVGAPVQSHLPLTGKPLVTEAADEGLLPGVDPLMDQHHALLGETFATAGAGEGPLP